MKVIRQCRTWIDQLVHNLSEEGWASRHLDDAAKSETSHTVNKTTSLSLALGMMGLVRQHSDDPIAH